MDYRTIGLTGMRVSALSFGASSLGGVFRGIDENEAIRSVYTAIEGGMNFIDVSPYYGHYKAETVQGKTLREIPRDKYILSNERIATTLFSSANPDNVVRNLPGLMSQSTGSWCTRGARHHRQAAASELEEFVRNL